MKLFFVALLPLLGGCAALSADSGFGTVETAARTRLGMEVKWARSADERDTLHARIKPLLAKPLTADDAVQIALLNNPGLQATYSELGIAEAARAQAGRLRNPGFSFARLERPGADGGTVEIERSFLFDVLGLLTLPTRAGIETRRFELTQQRVTA